MSKSIVIPDDCDLHKTYTHGRSQGELGTELNKSCSLFLHELCASHISHQKENMIARVKNEC